MGLPLSLGIWNDLEEDVPFSMSPPNSFVVPFLFRFSLVLTRQKKESHWIPSFQQVALKLFGWFLLRCVETWNRKMGFGLYASTGYG